MLYLLQSTEMVKDSRSKMRRQSPRTEGSSSRRHSELEPSPLHSTHALSNRRCALLEVSSDWQKLHYLPAKRAYFILTSSCCCYVFRANEFIQTQYAFRKQFSLSIMLCYLDAYKHLSILMATLTGSFDFQLRASCWRCMVGLTIAVKHRPAVFAKAT